MPFKIFLAIMSSHAMDAILRALYMYGSFELSLKLPGKVEPMAKGIDLVMKAFGKRAGDLVSWFPGESMIHISVQNYNVGSS